MDIESYNRSPRYSGITFGSLQLVVESMIGLKPETWKDLYTNPRAKVIPNIDFEHLRRIGHTHYLWEMGWQNIDSISKLEFCNYIWYWLGDNSRIFNSN